MAMGGVDQRVVRKETMRMKKLARKSEWRRRRRWQRLRSSRRWPFSRLFVTVIGTIVPGEFPRFEGKHHRRSQLPREAAEGYTGSGPLRWTGQTLSDRKATHLLQAVASSSGINPCFPKHTSSIQNDDQDGRLRRTSRPPFQEFINAEEPPLIVHWDGKLLPDLTGEGERNLVDRLPIIVSSPALEKEKLFGKCQSSQREREQRWLQGGGSSRRVGYQGEVVGMSFDTTASNTGIHTGCCRLLEEALGKPLLNLPCRHHVIELILAAAFKEVMGPSSGPTIQLLKRFRNSGPTIPHEDPEAIDNVVDPGSISFPSWKEASMGAMERGIQSKKAREDYREFVQPVPFYLTGNLRQPIKNREPSTTPVGWQRPNYVLKIRMFRSPCK
ncbi:hypothetical protein GWK47_003053 [Chionoecetes opilio]|uniref:Uncharacterized protein n=1 Tax=Chionoecetes opilio TaxID=41210 RepID=A0A8J8WES6_CHIOP|nr:hypothetical protein GWK47_003053 [Chionoecetes opilio]